MKETAVGLHQPVPADGEPAEVADPADRPLDDPAPAVAPELSPVLGRRLLAVGPVGDDGPDAPGPQHSIRGYEMTSTNKFYETTLADLRTSEPIITTF